MAVDPKTYVELTVDGDEIVKAFIQDSDYNYRSGQAGYSLVLVGPARIAAKLRQYLEKILEEENE